MDQRMHHHLIPPQAFTHWTHRVALQAIVTTVQARRTYEMILPYSIIYVIAEDFLRQIYCHIRHSRRSDAVLDWRLDLPD